MLNIIPIINLKYHIIGFVSWYFNSILNISWSFSNVNTANLYFVNCVLTFLPSLYLAHHPSYTTASF